jgi:PilZ domain
MLLHELPTKIARQLRIIVTRTDIPVIPATIALHELMKAHVRQTQSSRKKDSTMTQPRNEMEHRWGERIRMDMPVRVSADEVAGILGCMRNLSLSGALLRIDANLRLNALIEVSVELPQPSHPPAILLAHVSRKGKEDVGIEWCEFAPIVVKDLLRSPSMRLPL